MPVLCLWIFCIYPKSLFYIFTYQKSSQILSEYLCRPLSNGDKIEKLILIYIKILNICL